MTETNEPGRENGAHGNVCPRCGVGFTCGMQAGLPECWCASLPPLAAIPDSKLGCYCPDCLRSFLGGHGEP